MLQGAKHWLNNLKPKLSGFLACFCLLSSSPLPILPMVKGGGVGGGINIQLLTPPLHYIPS